MTRNIWQKVNTTGSTIVLVRLDGEERGYASFGAPDAAEGVDRARWRLDGLERT